MPEIGEVARVVSYIKKHLLGKTLAQVNAQADEIVYGKVGCSAEAFEKAMAGKKVVDAKQQGKYFWMVMSSPPHPLMHFGMAGWFKIRNEETGYYKPKKAEDPNDWPPKYWKYTLETAEEPKCEAAFVDFRRLARIRLIDCPAEDIRSVTPLKENGPDPVVDEDVVSEEWLAALLGRKKVPIKALLLDQANISGIGNWVGDELLYNARIHPEQYSNTLTRPQITQLHRSIHYICKFAVDNEADSSKFPEEWLFKHRWGKGKKDSTNTLPNGQKIVFLTVGGRTSCVVPSVQKKTGPVAGDVKEEANGDAESDEGETEVKPKKGKKTSKPSAKVENQETAVKSSTSKKRTATKQEPDGDAVTNGVGVISPAKKKRKVAATAKDETKTPVRKQKTAKPARKDANLDKPRPQNTKPASEAETITSGRRRSARVSGKGV